MTALGDALIELFDCLHAEAGCEVTYYRGGNAWGPLQAIKGGRNSTRFIGDDSGAYETARDDDFIVKVADWRALTNMEDPERLDRIVFTDEAGDEREYRLAEAEDERVYRDISGRGMLWRIHTVREQL